MTFSCEQISEQVSNACFVIYRHNSGHRNPLDSRGLSQLDSVSLENSPSQSCRCLNLQVMDLAIHRASYSHTLLGVG